MYDEPNKLDPTTLGQRLTEARKDARITQADAAAYLGMSRPTFIGMEKGVRPASPDEIVKLAAFYGRSVHELVRPGAPFVELEPHMRAALDSESRDIEGMTASVRDLADLAGDYRELETILHAPLKIVHPPEITLPSRGSLVDFAEDVAQRERQRLQLGDGPLHDLRTILENAVGVRIFYGALPKGYSGMYAYVPDLGYCILINRNHLRSLRHIVSLAHEYGHFLCDRHRPGVDRTDDERKPRNEQFCDAFAMGLLMPRSSVRQYFHDTVESSGDFKVSNLVGLSSFYGVSLEAATRRLEALGLVSKGTWMNLKEQGFSPKEVREHLGIAEQNLPLPEALPQRYRLLAVSAFLQDLISEGQLSRFLRCDRLKARQIVDELSNQTVDWSDGADRRQAQLGFSLIA